MSVAGGPAPAAVRGRPAVATVPELLASRAALDPGRTAIIAGAGRALTFAEWEARATSAAHGLLCRGVRPGDRIGLLFGNADWIDYAVAYCAVQRAGGVAVPLSDRLPAAEVRYMLGHCGATGLLRSDAVGSGVVGSGAAGGGGVWSARVSELDTGEAGAVDVAVRAGDLAQILYTSGTTGRPKGVAASHANLTYGRARHPGRRRLAHSEHFLHAYPIGTNAGQNMLVNALDARPAAVTAARFTPGHFGRLIESYRIGSVFVVPSMAIEMLSARVHERFDVSSVVLLGSTAAALPPRVAVELTRAFPSATVVNYYTSTEAAPAQTTMLFDPDRPASLGQPASGGDLRIADEHGQSVPAGTVGEVWLRAPATRTYYGDRAATAEAFRAGWVRMGDLGYLDADGYLYLVDRDSDVIKSGAYKVSTVQVEAAVYEHPAVVEAAVFGVPHEVLGMSVAAAVVARDPVSPADLRAFLTGRLAPHELPTTVLRLDALPRNAAGKVLKRELRARVAAARAGP